MCTVTWLHRPGEYQVLFNRDEKKARKPAHPPVVRSCNGVKYLAPTDGHAGGSWLAANEHGLTLGLLNHYPAERPTDERKISRGLLLLSLMDARGADEAVERLRILKLEDFKPFYLVAFAPDHPPRQSLWDGVRLAVRVLGDNDLPLTTSSFDSENVIAARREAFARNEAGEISAERLLRFHSHVDPRGAYGVFMRRPDAETVSFSRISVAAGRVDFYYAPRLPGSLDFPGGTVYSLARH